MDVNNMQVAMHSKVRAYRSEPIQIHVAPSESSVPSVDRVTLSQQGQDKAQQERDMFKVLREHAGPPGASENAQQVEDSEKQADKQSVDEKIAELKQKIDELMQRLSELKGQPGNEQQIKQLESELALLQSQMISLLEQKMQEQKSGKSSTE